MPKYIVFARGFVIFFLISHVLSYLVSSLQTYWIVKEVRKSGGKSGE